MADDPDSGRPHIIWHLLVGPPRRRRGAAKEQITPVEGLSALSLDALTSVAYGPEAIIVVLAVAGAGALHLILPDHRRHRRPPGHPGLLLPPGHRRLPRAAAAPTPCPGPTSGPASACVAGAVADRRLHAHRRRLDRRRRRRAHLRLPGLTSATVPICLGILAAHHPPQPPRPGRERPGLPAPDPGLHRRAARHHRRRADPPPRPATRRSPGSPLVPTHGPRDGRASCWCSRPSRPAAAPSPAWRPSPTASRCSRSPGPSGPSAPSCSSA